MNLDQAYDWLAPKLQTSERKVLDVIYAAAKAGGARIAAWAHEEDPARVISAAQKAQAERDGGASASSVKPYSVPLVRGSN